MSEWKEYKLGDVSDVVGGGTPSTVNSNYWNGDIHWLKPRDLSNFHDVKPIRLREQVKRNPKRFPPDFMLQLCEEEVELLLSQNAILSEKD